jgi:predicted metallo-beta-lactamase superfamily hydrolase
MFMKRSEVIEYLVAKGYPLNKVKVAIDQGYNFDKNGDMNGHCRVGDDDTAPISVSEADAVMMYNTFDEMIEVTPDGIMVDGDMQYDLNGDWHN